MAVEYCLLLQFYLNPPTPPSCSCCGSATGACADASTGSWKTYLRSSTVENGRVLEIGPRSRAGRSEEMARVTCALMAVGHEQWARYSVPSSSLGRATKTRNRGSGSLSLPWNLQATLSSQLSSSTLRHAYKRVQMKVNLRSQPTSVHRHTVTHTRTLAGRLTGDRQGLTGRGGRQTRTRASRMTGDRHTHTHTRTQTHTHTNTDIHRHTHTHAQIHTRILRRTLG